MLRQFVVLIYSYAFCALYFMKKVTFNVHAGMTSGPGCSSELSGGIASGLDPADDLACCLGGGGAVLCESVV